jgi:hypothetical protein
MGSYYIAYERKIHATEPLEIIALAAYINLIIFSVVILGCSLHTRILHFETTINHS